MITAYIPAFFAVLGALVYGFAASQKATELGRIAYGCGLLVALYVLASHVVHLP